MMGFKGASLFPSSNTGTGESLGFSLLLVLLCLFLLGRWGAGTRYGMRRDAPSLPAYKTEAPLTFFCGARSTVLSSTDISMYTCIRIQRNARTRILAWLSRCPNLNNAIGLPWVFSASLFHLRVGSRKVHGEAMPRFRYVSVGNARIIFIWLRQDTEDRCYWLQIDTDVSNVRYSSTSRLKATP